MIDTDQCASFPVAESVQQDVSPGTKERRPIDNSPPIPDLGRQRVIHSRLFRKHAPYRSSSKVSRLSAQFMKQELQLEQLTQEDKECLDTGLSQMRFTTAYEGFSTMVAARETARQRLLVTAWEIEEAERLSMFLEPEETQAEHEGQLSRADEVLRVIKGFFTQHYQAGVEGSKDYLQAIGEEERETFRKMTTQATHVSNLLGGRVTRSLHSNGDSSSQPSDTFANGEDPSDYEEIHGGEYTLHDLDVDSQILIRDDHITHDDAEFSH